MKKEINFALKREIQEKQSSAGFVSSGKKLTGMTALTVSLVEKYFIQSYEKETKVTAGTGDVTINVKRYDERNAPTNQMIKSVYLCDLLPRLVFDHLHVEDGAQSLKKDLSLILFLFFWGVANYFSCFISSIIYVAKCLLINL